MASMKGKYFQRPKLLSEKVQDLIDEVLSLPSVDTIAPVVNRTERKENESKQQAEQGSGSNLSAKQQAQLARKQQREQKKAQARAAKASKKGQQNNQKKNENETPPIGRCEFVVGKIISVKNHPNADKMYVEMVDIGENEPRQIVSGLRDWIPIEEMRDSLIVVFKNLKPAPLRDIISYGMVFAANDKGESNVELVRPAKGSIIGERLVLENDDLTKYKPDEKVNSKKKNSAWKKIFPLLRTNDKKQACYNGVPFMTSAGPLIVKSLANCQIS